MLRVGTSGWQYAHWRRRFYPPAVPLAGWLDHYASRFGTVEVNNTFYRLPDAVTFERWRARTPPGFVFALKASRFLTHVRRLRDPAGPVALLLERARHLGDRLGPVLLQLPPDLRVAPDRLDETLAAFGGRVRVAVEPRHPSWWCDEVHAVLRAHGAALCLADRGSRPVTPLWRTAGWAYVRFHHGTGSPTSCYGRRALAAWAQRLRDLYGPGADGYAYFNNDAGACALRDAIRFAHAAARAGMRTSAVPAAAEVRVGQAGSSRTTSSGGLSVR
ncbi:MAG: histidine kinase [Acidimicrobiia bacterium]|nr:MAG: histidine kinase [Acidimicrobiia bacterium]